MTEAVHSIELATAIMTREPVADLRAHLNERLRPWRLRLDEDEGSWLVYQDDVMLGIHYEIVPPEAFADRPWRRPQHPCPFVGSLAGYVRWDYRFEYSPVEEIREFALALLREGRGVTARLEDDRAFEAVRLHTFDLPSALGKWGIHDGDALLTRDEGPYSEYVLDAVYRAIAGAGCQYAHVSWMSTCHNPLRISSFQPAGSDRLYPALWGPDGELADPDQALSGARVDLWTYDFEPLDDADFWEIPEDLRTR